MQTITLNTQEANTNKRAVRLNAVYNSKQQELTATAEERKQAQTAFDLLDYAYNYTQHFITWRKKFVTIKFVNAKVKDDNMLMRVEDYLEAQGATKVQTQQGLIYRLAR